MADWRQYLRPNANIIDRRSAGATPQAIKMERSRSGGIDPSVQQGTTGSDIGAMLGAAGTTPSALGMTHAMQTLGTMLNYRPDQHPMLTPEQSARVLAIGPDGPLLPAPWWKDHRTFDPAEAFGIPLPKK